MTTVEQQPRTIEASAPYPAQRARRAPAHWRTRHVPTPTYEVVGPLERFDERDRVDLRASLRPGTPEYQEYYGANPELEARDRRFRFYPTVETQEAKRGKVYGRYPFGLALTYAAPVQGYLAPYVDGTPRGEVVEVDPKTASENIKSVARYLGADLVGICELNQAWVYSHVGHGPNRGRPIHLSHHYAITFAVAHDFDVLLASRGFSLGCTIETNEIARSKLSFIGMRLASYIRALGYPARAHTGAGQLLSIPVAVDAGLGEISRAGYVLTKEYGPAVRPATVTTDMPLAVDKPVDLGVQDFCAKCIKCANVCPVGAISKGGKEVIRGVRLWPFDAEKCYRLRMALGDTPCMYCMSACPWTKPRNVVHQTVAQLAIHLPITRKPLIWVDDLLYGHKPRMHALPAWIDPYHHAGLGERISTLLHKI